MADAALSLSPNAPSGARDRSDTLPQAWGWAADRLCALCGVLALSWVPISLWPGLRAPAWPAASLGLVALALAFLPGRVIPKALGMILGFGALVLGSAEILTLWSVAWVAS